MEAASEGGHGDETNLRMPPSEDIDFKSGSNHYLTTMNGTKKEEQYQIKWSNEQTVQFIKLRQENAHLFTGVKYSAALAWGTILEKMDLSKKVTPTQAKKKWDNLKRKYKECTCQQSIEGVSGKATASTWPWFGLMDDVLNHMHSNSPSVLIGPVSEDAPGPSSAVDEPLEPEIKRKRKVDIGDREDLLLEFIKEEIRFQREADERRAQESKERIDRLYGLLEKLVKK